VPIFVTRPASDVHPALGFIGYRAPLLAGGAGTAQTIKLMRKLVDQAVGDASFVRHAIDIVRHVPAYHDLGEASTVYDWVTHNIRYTKDPVTKEKLYPPAELLRIRAGDCDDIAMLMSALMIALGYPARVVTIGANAENPEEFTHVYAEAEVPPGSGNWVSMDAARPGATFGVEPPAYFRKRAWSLTDDSFADLTGLGGLGCQCGGSCSSCRVGQAGLCGLAGYTRVAQPFVVRAGHLGQDGIDWGSIIQSSIQEVPAIIATSSGQGTQIRNPYGTVATGPYSSYATQYTPGYGVPYAGYTATASSSTIWPWVIGVGLLALALGGRRS
jgi:hypothetical protein